MAKHLLIIQWARGDARKMPDYDDTGKLIWVDYYPNDAPVSHNAYRDAALINDMWTVTRECSRRNAEYIGNEEIKHLASWGITATIS